jgi:hypothetical protein
MARGDYLKNLTPEQKVEHYAKVVAARHSAHHEPKTVKTVSLQRKVRVNHLMLIRWEVEGRLCDRSALAVVTHHPNASDVYARVTTSVGCIKGCSPACTTPFGVDPDTILRVSTTDMTRIDERPNLSWYAPTAVIQ